MILQALNELYDRLKDDERYGIAPPGYSRQKIGFKVVLTKEGELWGVEDLRSSDSKRRPQVLLVPGGSKPSGGVTEASIKNKVLPLRNDLPFLLGLKEERGEGSKGTGELIAAPLEFEAFREVHLANEELIADEHYSLLCAFLRSWTPEIALERSRETGWADFASSQGLFQIIGETSFVHERPAICKWWLDSQSKAAEQSESSEGQCMVSGRTGPLARLHEPKIKGIQGAQSAGAAIVTFNAPAYESYGKEQGHNAPVSEAVANHYTKALNALTDGPLRSKHRLQLGDTSLVFWTDRPTSTEDVFAQFAAFGTAERPDDSQDPGQLQKLQAFTLALRRGREAYGDLEEDAEGTAFYMLGLAPNQSRLSVRFFHRSTVAELLDRLRTHQQHIAVEPQPAHGKRPADPEFPALRQLLDQTCPVDGKGKPDREKIPPILAGPFLRATITGTPYPAALCSAVMRRIRAGDSINYLRACLISGYLRRNLNLEIPVSLDTTRNDTSYRLGRLFAALEKTQKDALEGINATIRDRFYSSASATPGSVFPRLLRTYQHHLAKLDGGHKVNRERLVQEILGEVADIPPHLDMAAQGLFALGYYHQTQALYTKKES